MKCEFCNEKEEIKQIAFPKSHLCADCTEEGIRELHYKYAESKDWYKE